MSDLDPDKRRSDMVGRLLMVIVASSLIAIGGLFITLMGRSYLRAKQMRSWPEVSCLILQSSIEQRQHDPYSPAEFRHNIAYAYDWNGEAYIGEKISLRGSKWSSKRQTAAGSFEQYPVGILSQCYVKPDEPSFAVLERDSMAPLYSIWFPALFVIGGAGMLVTSFRPRKSS